MRQKSLKIKLFPLLLSFFLVTMASAQSETSMTKPGESAPPNSMSNADTTNNSARSLSPHDQQFLDSLAQGSEGEVALAKIVVQKTTNPQVKDFAERMIGDHSMLDTQAKKVFAEFGLQPPSPMTPGQQQLKVQLEKESGKQLDETYMAAQVKEHEKDLSAVTPEAEHGEKLHPSDPTVTELAEEARPVIQQHLQLAKMIAKEIGASPSSSDMAK